jgi:hypothetical protein
LTRGKTLCIAAKGCAVCLSMSPNPWRNTDKDRYKGGRFVGHPAKKVVERNAYDWHWTTPQRRRGVQLKGLIR